MPRDGTRARARLREAALETAALVDAMVDALVQRGTTPSTARLTAKVAIAAFEHANRQWVGRSHDRRRRRDRSGPISPERSADRGSLPGR
jgi:hypothetical protein